VYRVPEILVGFEIATSSVDGGDLRERDQTADLVQMICEWQKRSGINYYQLSLLRVKRER